MPSYTLEAPARDGPGLLSAKANATWPCWNRDVRSTQSTAAISEGPMASRTPDGQNSTSRFLEADEKRLASTDDPQLSGDLWKAMDRGSVLALELKSFLRALGQRGFQVLSFAFYAFQGNAQSVIACFCAFPQH